MLVRLPLNVRLLEAPGTVSFTVLSTVDCMSRAMLMAIIPLQAYATLGNARDLSILYFVIAWGAFAGRFIIPKMISKFRRRRMYSAGLLMLAFSPLMLGLDTLPTLAAGMFLRSFGAACVNITLNLYIMDYVAKQELTRMEPFKYAFSGIAWGGGPLIGILLFEHAGPWVAYGIATGISLLALAFFWYMRIKDDPIVAKMTAASPKPFSVLSYLPRFFKQPRLVLAWCLGLGRETFWGALIVYGPVLIVAKGGSQELGGILVSAANGMMFAALLFGWIGRKHGIRRVLIGGFAAAGLATLAVAFAPDNITFVIALLLLASISITACDSCANVTFMRAVKKRERPEMTMVYSTYSDASSILPAAVYSGLLSVFPLVSVFLSTGAAMFGFAWIARKVPRSM